jgi:hypothetical protein
MAIAKASAIATAASPSLTNMSPPRLAPRRTAATFAELGKRKSCAPPDRKQEAQRSLRNWNAIE